jgi:dTDP-glucose 4,6-dehydratase
MKRVLLTGAGGFVGHHTLGHLLQVTDWEVVCTDSFRHMGKTDRLREVLAEAPEQIDRVTVLTHDLRAPVSQQLAYEIGHVDYVIAMASESHVDRSISDPRPFVENNVSVALTVLEYAREVGVEKLVHVSTDEVYGPAPIGVDHLEGAAHRPSNPYSASKACQEAIVYAYWRTYGMPCAIASSMNMIGERQDPEKFVPLALGKILAGDPVPVHVSAGGSQGSRFYLHARNYANALIFLLEQVPFPLYDGENEMERFNVVGEEMGNFEMAGLIADCAGFPLMAKPVDFHTYRPGHDLRYALDGQKMAALGWVPPLALADSLERTVEWTMAHPEWLAHTRSQVHPAAA